MSNTPQRLSLKRLSQLHPRLKAITEDMLAMLEDWLIGTGVKPYIAFAWRSPEQQNRIWMKGRIMENGRWRVLNRRKVRTYATAEQSLHCRTDPSSGEPSAEAVDIALIKNGAWLPDDDPRWVLVGAAAALVAHDEVRLGAMFKNLRDYAHVELRHRPT